MKKEEARTAFNQMFSDWAKTKSPEYLKDPGYYEFCEWVGFKGYGHYFDFQSVIGSREDVRQWFIKHFNQNSKY